MATVTKSPGLTSISPLSFLNSSMLNERFGLQAGVDDDDVEVDANDLGGDELALAHFLAWQRFLEQLREIFHRRIGGGGGGGIMGVAVAMRVGSFIRFANRRAQEPNFSRRRAGGSIRGKRTG